MFQDRPIRPVENMKNDNTETIRIVKLNADQWEIYRDIRLKGLQEDPQAFGRSYDEEIKYDKEKWVQRTGGEYTRVAMENGEAIGTMSAYVAEQNGAKVAHIVGVFVAKKARGRGVGSKLLAEILKKLKENPDIKKVELSVNKDQVSAVGLYEKFGFKIIGEDSFKMGDGKEHEEYKMGLDL